MLISGLLHRLAVSTRSKLNKLVLAGEYSSYTAAFWYGNGWENYL